MAKQVRLGVNIDHVATIRQARGVNYPDPVRAALVAIKAGADGITLHLREDRRHIQEKDLASLKAQCTVPINLEMAVQDDMIHIAKKYLPNYCCFVPEKREELTTEGGLDVVLHKNRIDAACNTLSQLGIKVSLFIDPEVEQVEAALRCGAPMIEIHTGHYANASSSGEMGQELERIRAVAHYASKKGLIVNAGHGLNYENVRPIVAIPQIHELNIGHGIISEAIFSGLPAVVVKMKNLLQRA